MPPNHKYKYSLVCITVYHDTTFNICMPIEYTIFFLKGIYGQNRYKTVESISKTYNVNFSFKLHNILWEICYWHVCDILYFMAKCSVIRERTPLFQSPLWILNGKRHHYFHGICIDFRLCDWSTKIQSMERQMDPILYTSY